MPKRFSTKNLDILASPSAQRAGIGVFEFTDDYSIFHFGKMPDRIPHKGEAVCRIAALNYGLLERNGLATHYRRSVDATRIEFDLLRILNPAEQAIEPGQTCYMVPLQVVCRNSLPPGNSITRRLEAKTVTLAQLGLSRLPAPMERLASPIVEFTTKLEEIDRFITPEEAMRVAGVTAAQLDEVRDAVLTVNRVMSEKAESIGLVLADGKAEFGLDAHGRLILVDHAGTPDENRLLHQGFHVSKQVLRDYYLPTDIERKVQQWAERGVPRSAWDKQASLPTAIIPAVSRLYQSLCELWVGEKIWGAPALSDVIGELSELQRLRVA